MYRVAALVHHGSKVAHGTCRVHEDERRTGFGQRVVIATRSFALAALYIKQAVLFHYLQTLAQVTANVAKTLYRFFYQLFAVFKRLKGWFARNINLGIPGL